MTPLQEAAIADIKSWYGARFDLLVQEFRAEKHMPYSEFQLYLSADGVNGFPALALYKYIFPNAVAIARSKHNG
jgi:hypothetical protein